MPYDTTHPVQDYFLKDFYTHDNSICYLYALLCWQNFILQKVGVTEVIMEPLF
jgi:hypothetical protein